MISENYILFWFMQLFIVLLSISLGRSLLIYRIRKEENKHKKLELELLNKRSHLMHKGRPSDANLDELLYKAKVQQEIDDIIRKSDN
ncbi:MAG: hypothetical protein GF398_01300 [Chitinivibrionales bacterium]|nr:hypothetical protein [Chitinivibrionales bacterium]